ncbi:hypothetical protein CUJ89_12790 [Burkholderia pyrrocinia]|uniref:DUF2345 domain-containing protein n=1 Tax=Burkholderia pyrrocinia TaxID=60550 RepID=A0A2Z5MVA4_BURPY|nr:hypothetical protein CUJ89_12790 [Burkholderia pyrrocinia]
MADRRRVRGKDERGRAGRRSQTARRTGVRAERRCKLDGGNIELGCPGTFTVKAAGHSWGGPALPGGFDAGSALGLAPARRRRGGRRACRSLT